MSTRAAKPARKARKWPPTTLPTALKTLGLTGPVTNSDNPYLQHFTMVRSTWADGASLKVGKASYKWLTDFYGLRGLRRFQQETTVQPVFAGYGIEQEGYSDYAGFGRREGQGPADTAGRAQTSQGNALLSKDGQPQQVGPGLPGQGRAGRPEGCPLGVLR